MTAEAPMLRQHSNSYNIFILVLVSATQVEDVRLKMPDAQEVKTVPVDEETAGAIKAAAAAADKDAPAAEAPAEG